VCTELNVYIIFLINHRPELADPVSATVARSQQTRFADAPEDEYHFMIERDGFVEESFFLWSLVPLGGLIDGMYSIVTEVTKQRYATGLRVHGSVILLTDLDYSNVALAQYFE
jgi:hypothetical protein